MEYIICDPAVRSPLPIAHYLIGLQQILDLLGRLEPCIPRERWWEMALAVRNMRETLEALEESMGFSEGLPPHAPMKEWTRDNGGRPKQVIDVQELLQYHYDGYSDAYIAKVLGCSVRTLQRRRDEAGITKRNFSDIDDTALALVSFFA